MVQNWQRLKWIFDTETHHIQYAAIPLCLKNEDGTYRIFISDRDLQSRSTIKILDFNADWNLKTASETSKLQCGTPGSFDEFGTMGTSILKHNSDLWLYYIGWNLTPTVPFRNSIGLAKWDPRTQMFIKLFKGPILDRSIHDPCFVASCHVLQEENLFRIWYLSCIKWAPNQDGKLEHHYHIKYAESRDGVNWIRDGRIAIDFKYPNEYAVSVPRVIKDRDIYRMWFSYRGGPMSEFYRIGYAESDDGITWDRKDSIVNFDVSTDPRESQMLCYPYIWREENKFYMLYNGNGYGKTGIGLACWDSQE